MGRLRLFRYEALDRSGRAVVGTMEVADEAALAARLAAAGYRATRIEQVGGSHPGTPAAPRTAAIARLSLREEELLAVLHQLHAACRAGMPLYQALTTVAGQAAGPRARRLLEELARQVRDGGRLSDGMERFPRVFLPGDRGTVRAAELGGFLPEGLAALAERREEEYRAARRMRLAAGFFHANAVLFCCLLAVLPFFRTSIEAGFDVGAGLRAVQRVFYTVSLPLAALYLLGLRGLAAARGSRAWHRWLAAWPPTARVQRQRALAALTRGLHRLGEAGIVGGTAWEAAAGGVPNRVLAERFARAGSETARTGRASAGLRELGLLDPAELGLILAAEEAGNPVEALGWLADRFELQAREALHSAAGRGALSFAAGVLLLGAAGMVAMAASYYGQIFPAVSGAMGE